ncbi:MAG: beta-mannosidase [Ruminococcus sp.]|nr:beta-mannosidase [Ruminococcus sp.]MBP3309411.1 beta-mannosidase [Ruminococcus sp.]
MGVFRLKEGVNEITLKPQYGYAAYDTMTISKAISHDYSKATDQLTDPKATDEAKALMKYLKSVYGSHIISGQQEIYGGGSDAHKISASIRYDAASKSFVDGDGNIYTYNEEDVATADDGSTFVWKCYDKNGKKFEYNQQNRNYSCTNYDLEFDYIYDISGKYPAIRGFDMMNYNPLYGWEDGSTERLIDWVNKRGGIATVAWHINVPIDFENYEVGDVLDWKDCTYKNYQVSNSTFNTANVLVEGSKEREYFEAAMEDLAEQLLLCQEAGVPIIFRPLHEAQGNEGNYSDGTAWFWWGDRGAEVYKELWKLLYTTMTETYGLHNLIWEFNSYNYSNSHTWYPGDEYVDIVAYDKYNVEYNRGDGNSSGPNVIAISSIFNYIFELVDGKKMIAMSENDTVPTVENMVIEDAGWLYFCPWYGDYLMSERYQDADTLAGIYKSDYCITLDELPADLYEFDGSNVTPPQGTTGNEDIAYGDANCDDEINMADAVLIMQSLANPDKYVISEQGQIYADVSGNKDGITNKDALAIQKYKLGLIASLPEA